jgi:alpha-L-fucosidase
MTYEPNWESIDSRPVPQWFGDAKFGIFMHWGLYSVPAFAPKGKYAEWYWENLVKKEEYWDFHVRTYGEDFAYQDFVKDFTVEAFDADEWAQLFADAGARYFTITSKHHDGFCLWPSAYSWNWNSVDVGPHRDLLGELTTAVRKHDAVKMGFYYSLYEWYHPFYLRDVHEYVDKHMIPQMKEMIERYEPSILFTDGEWDYPSDVWRSTEVLTWMFNEGPRRDELVVNDRWGKETRSVHGGYFTTEYGEVGFGSALTEGRVWEECRGIGASFGFNRTEVVSDYMSSQECIHLLINTVSKGGNLLLNIGPTADGRIPVIQQERLLDMGAWLKVNSEAIYSTRPWKNRSTNENINYTSTPDALYAICLKWQGNEIAIDSVTPGASTTVTLLGHDAPLTHKEESGSLRVALPNLLVDDMPCQHAYVIKITDVT